MSTGYDGDSGDEKPDTKKYRGERPETILLLERSLDEVVSNKDPRKCDHCGDEQLFGCVARVSLGWEYREMCLGCFEALARSTQRTHEALEKKRGAVKSGGEGLV